MEYPLAQLIESSSLIVLGLMFACLEFLSPYRRDSWKRQFPLDLLSALIFVSTVALTRHILYTYLPEFHLLGGTLSHGP